MSFWYRNNPFRNTFSFGVAAIGLVSAGATGYDLSRHRAFLTGTHWTGSVIWWEVGLGAVALFLAAYHARKATRTFTGLRPIPEAPSGERCECLSLVPTLRGIETCLVLLATRNSAQVVDCGAVSDFTGSESIAARMLP